MIFIIILLIVLYAAVVFFRLWYFDPERRRKRDERRLAYWEKYLDAEFERIRRDVSESVRRKAEEFKAQHIATVGMSAFIVEVFQKVLALQARLEQSLKEEGK